MKEKEGRYLYPDLLGAEVIDFEDRWGLMYRFSIPNPTGQKPKSWDMNLQESLKNDEDCIYGDLATEEYTQKIKEFERLVNTDDIFLSVGYHFHTGQFNRPFTDYKQLPETYDGGFFIELSKEIEKDPTQKKWVLGTMASLAVSYHMNYA